MKIQIDTSKIIKKLEKDISASLKKTGQLVYEEAVNMYDSFIDQYYRQYNPVSYVRHLYRMNPSNGISAGGDDISFDGDTLIIGFHASTMPDDYQRDSAYDVLMNVMSGFRGVPGYWIRPWSGTYVGELFSYSGTMERAFQLYGSQIERIVTDRTLNDLRDKGWF